MKNKIILLILISFYTTIFAHHVSNRTKKFVIVYDENWAPYSYKDNNGKAKGILPTLMRELLHNRLGIEVENLVFPAKRAHEFVEEGIYDAFVLNHEASEKEESIVISKNSLLSIEIAAFLYTDSINYLKNLNSKDPIYEKNNVFCKLLSDEATNDIMNENKIYSHKSKNLESAINMLKTERTDFFIGEKTSTLSFLYQKSLQDQIVMHPKIINEVPMNLMVNNKRELNRDALEKLDNLIGKMKKDGSYFILLEQIEEKILKEILIKNKLY